jgi:hypothetical protein
MNADEPCYEVGTALPADRVRPRARETMVERTPPASKRDRHTGGRRAPASMRSGALAEDVPAGTSRVLRVVWKAVLG